MAIKPSSDIVLDVLRAADPARVQAATQRLATLAAGGAGDPDDFARALDAADPSPAPAAVAPTPDASDMRDRLAGIGGADAEAAKAARTEIDFEASILKSFVDEILPKDESSVYGEGTAGDMWKSMLSDQIARQIAKSGAFGIAKQLFATHPLPGGHPSFDSAALGDAALRGAAGIAAIDARRAGGSEGL